MHSKTLTLHTQISVASISHQNTSFCSRWTSSQKSTAGQNAEVIVGFPVPMNISVTHFLHPRNIKEKGVREDIRAKELEKSADPSPNPDPEIVTGKHYQ